MENKKPLKHTEIKCKFCDYEWTTLSQMIMVSCPSCLKKNENKEKDKDVE